jgi:hypothetical protein
MSTEPPHDKKKKLRIRCQIYGGNRFAENPGIRRLGACIEPVNDVTLPSECVPLNQLVLGDFYSSPVVVVAVGMWESASSISKVCGKGGKQHYRFPGFPSTVISTASSCRHEHSCGDEFARLIWPTSLI